MRPKQKQFAILLLHPVSTLLPLASTRIRPMQLRSSGVSDVVRPSSVSHGDSGFLEARVLSACVSACEAALRQLQGTSGRR